ncbi:putative endopeptidase [Luteibacter sp. UNCMF331Sha3.1]|uniref:M13 family metallopeptidase n=1 Tax=Luteibacter sp. UNCMF331Sha3.1 TaxID=1502760 RepID=UPI0008D01A27|nr:M13 family metallopeptidase [Luteibacter sp. UNCMF331Sha3.1]SEN12123.1 putative endopeptidase [Luteibacter sp. UNCMF331Sha3.1]
MILRFLSALALTVVTAASASSFDNTGMDRSIRPGDDFYLYANGTWERRTTVSPDAGVTYGNAAARATSVGHLLEILRDAAADPTSRAGALYRSFMDERAIEARGMTPAAPTLAAIGRIVTRDEAAVAMARLTRMGVDTLFDGGPDDDDRHPGHRALHWSGGGLGMRDRGRYLPGAAGGPAIARAYRAYVRQLLSFAGVSDADRLAASVLAFETRLATPRPSEADGGVFDQVSVRDLERRMPGMPWARVIGTLGWPPGRAMRIDDPDVFTAAMKAFVETPVETLRAYLVVRFLDTYAPYLPSPVADAAFAFDEGVLRGTVAQKSRAERAIGLVHEFIPDDIEAVYAARYFPPQSKAQVEDLVVRIKQAFSRRLASEAWMDEATRQRALVKLKNVAIEVGYPQAWHRYEGLSFDARDVFGNVVRGHEWAWTTKLAQLDRPVDRREWTCLYPSTVNACADNGRLVLFFPAAYLQPPIFDPAYDAADIYGRIGATIGHELTHQFDPGGSTFDENGLRRPWWPAAVRTAFVARTDALRRQYDDYEAAPGLTIDGKLTLGENAADLGGLVIAHDAFLATGAGHDLPVVDELTGEQRFFIAYAMEQRARYNDARLRAQLLNVHAPGHQRAFEVRNVDAWYDAFGVKPGDALYLAPEARVRIW